MGNSNPKPTKLSKLGDRRWHSSQSQFSASSVGTTQSTYSASRTWSRGSRRRTKAEVHGEGCRRYEGSKTAWPVSITESIFLPEFPIKGVVSEASFEVDGVVARGAFGKVLKVRKQDTGTTFVMKVLSKSRIIVENAVQQCKDEVTIQVMCGRHPFIVNCQYYWQSKKHLFLVTDYVPHGELLQLWKQNICFPEKVALLFVAEISIALDYLQNCGVIHRDLKMENILLDKEGHVQLIDFGLSKWLQQGGRANTICGTIQYMAPEILSMETYTHAVDWWSLGIILYTLLMGRYPLDGVRDHTKMSELVLSFDYCLAADISLETRLLEQKLICKDPAKRLQSLRQMRWEPCFADVDFNRVKAKQISPFKLLEEATLMARLGEKDILFGTSRLVSISKGDPDMGLGPVTDTFEDFPWISEAEIF